MVKKAFWENPYQTELTTTVTSVNENTVTLSETIFYAFSGGQESDTGTINGIEVVKAEKQGKEIFYTLADSHSLKTGDTVELKIDWNRRYKLMRLHFAAELVLELFCQLHPNTPKVGAHIAQDKSRIDFEWDRSIAPHLPDLQARAQEIVNKNRPVISAFNDIENERRYWKIEDFSQVPCGGTHIKNTKEIGTITLKRKNPGKGKERIEIFVSENSV